MGAPSSFCLAWSAAFGATLVATAASLALFAPLSPPRAAVSPLLLLLGLFLCYVIFLTRGTPPEDVAFASQVSFLCFCVWYVCMCMLYMYGVLYLYCKFVGALSLSFVLIVQNSFLQVFVVCTQRLVPAHSFFLRLFTAILSRSFSPSFPLILLVSGFE